MRSRWSERHIGTPYNIPSIVLRLYIDERDVREKSDRRDRPLRISLAVLWPNEHDRTFVIISALTR